MKKKLVISLIILVVLLAAGYTFFIRGGKKDVQFTYAEITRGDISQTIISTGTLQALSTVDIGTQVSGRIAKIFVDFNSNVKKGQLLAMLDTTLLAAQVRDSKATVNKTKAQVAQLQNINEKNTILYQKNLISEVDYITSKTNFETAEADLQSAESALDRAKTNLAYAFIRSPINGKVQNRAIEEGQTVAASLSSPTLFTIAEDLSLMKILANVDESDIGQIAVGQRVDFTVQAFPDKKFTGNVVQIRMNSQVVSNVVNYTVVINASNKENLLLPGMTATVDFYIVERNNVLLVPNAALRFQPTDEMIQTVNKEQQNKPDSLRRPRTYMNKSQGKKQTATLWYFDSNKKLRTAFIITGITDGKSTEIVRGKDLKEGIEVISGIIDNNTSENTQRPANNLLNPGNNMPRGSRRGF